MRASACAALLALACDQAGEAVALRSGSMVSLDSESSITEDGGDGDVDGTTDGEGTSGGVDIYIDLWEDESGGETLEGPWPGDDGGTGGSDTGDTGGSSGGVWIPPVDCEPGQFKILIYVELKNGSQGSVDLASGTLYLMSAETQGTTVYRELLACIDAGQIFGPNAPGVRVHAAVAGTDPNDYVVGMRRGIDHNWIGQCLGNPAKACWIDAKFNANGTNTLPIAQAVVIVKFDRMVTVPAGPGVGDQK